MREYCLYFKQAVGSIVGFLCVARIEVEAVKIMRSYPQYANVELKGANMIEGKDELEMRFRRAGFHYTPTRKDVLEMINTEIQCFAEGEPMNDTDALMGARVYLEYDGEK